MPLGRCCLLRSCWAALRFGAGDLCDGAARTWSWRASALPVADRGCVCVFLVAHVFAPRDDAALLVGLLHRDMRHEPLRRSAVPVILARLEEDAIAGPDHFDRPGFALAETDAFRHPDRLAVRVRVPRSTRTGRE